MAASKGRYWRSLVFSLVLIGGLWGSSIAVHAVRLADNPDERFINLGLDLQGGISVVLSPVGEGEVEGGSLEKARDIIARRVDGLGVAEPDIALEGSNIAIQLPGVTRANDALAIIGTTAKMSFRPVLGAVGEDAEGEGLPVCGDQATYPEDDPEKEVVYCLRAPEEGPDALPPEDWPRLRLGPAALSGDDVSDARAQFGDGSGGGSGWAVSLDLNREGGRKFEEITGTLACQQLGSLTRQLAITLDGVIESSPQMGDDIQCNQGISGGNAVITGTFSESEARDLGLVLRYGALPIELEAATTTTVSPTLGRDSLRGGLLAGAIGMAVLLIYVLAFYRGLGLVIWLGLVLHGALTLGFVVLLGKTVGFTLTLAGIAGLIISLGIATDSFIVYLERLKDEIRSGRGVRASVDRAWTAAWRTILAADFVTAMAALVLYLIAVGGVRGFALMLGIATTLDVLISRMYMHPAVWLLAQTKMMERSKALGVRAIAGIEPQVAGGSS